MIVLDKQADPEKNYQMMVKTVALFLEEETDVIANLSNISAIINGYMTDLNWAGFYLLKGEDLVLGPFQGKPACIRIKPAKGVCFAAVLEKRTILVPDVEVFPGHIACDGDTKSELVAPLFKKGEIYGVLDLDSPILNRFTSLEEKYINQVAELINQFLSK